MDPYDQSEMTDISQANQITNFFNNRNGTFVIFARVHLTKQQVQHCVIKMVYFMCCEGDVAGYQVLFVQSINTEAVCCDLVKE